MTEIVSIASLYELEKKYRNAHFPILTVYLGFAGKKTPTTQMILSLFHSYIHRFLSDEEQKHFRNDIKRITTYLSDAFDSRGKRSVVFMTSGKELWEIMLFEFYLPPLVVVGYSPYLTPVFDALDVYQKYLVVLIDRQKAMMFSVRNGKLENQKELHDGHVPQRVRVNEERYFGRVDKIERHIDEHLHRHLKKMADAVSEFARSEGGKFIILGGHKDMLGKVKTHLSPSLQGMVVHEFITELNIPLNTLFMRSKSIAEELETDWEKERLSAKLKP